MSAATQARADSVYPKWVESVSVIATFDQDTGQLVTNVYQGGGSDSWDQASLSYNHYTGEYTSYETLVDYENVTGPITIQVFHSYLFNSDPSIPAYAPLVITQLPASP